MSETDHELLELEKLRIELTKMKEETEFEVARRYNWAQQERHWRYQQWALAGAFLLGVLGLILRVW